MKLLQEEIFRIKSLMNLPTQKSTILESNAIFGGTEVDVNNFEVGNYYYSYYIDLFWVTKILEINGDNLTYLEIAFDEDAVKYDKEPVKYTNPKWILLGSPSPESPPTRTFWETSEKIWNYVLTFTYVDDYDKDTDCKKCVPADNIKVGKYYIYKKEAFDEIVKIKSIDGDKITADYIEYNVLTKFDNPDEYIYDIKTFDNRWDLSDEKTWKHVMSLPIMEDVVKGSGFDTDKKKEQKRKEQKRKEENNQITDKEPDIKKDTTLDNLEDYVNADQSGKEKYLGPLGEYEGDFKDSKFHGKGKLNTNLSELDQIVFNPVTKNFHDKKFVYEGDFVDGNIEGKGIITFQDGSKYVGTFKDNKIEGFGTFTFPDMSTYEGIFETNLNSGDNTTYTYETSDGILTDDLVEYNADNIVQQIKFSEDETEGFNSTFDLKINIISGDKNEIIGGVSGQPYAVKNTDIEFKNTIFKNKNFKTKTSTGQVVFADFKLGNYDVYVNVPGVTKIKQNMIIDKKFINGMTIKVKPTVKENYLTEQNKHRRLTKEEKDALKQCEIDINNFYTYYTAFYKKTMNFETVFEEEIEEMKENVTSCITTFYNHLSDDTKKKAKQLTNVGPTMVGNKNLQDYFDINFNINENKDIYMKTNDMSISNSIKKIIREQAQKKQDSSVEKTIIKNRLKFVIENSVRTDLNRNIINESIFLTQRGYDKKLIKDVLNNLIK